MKDGLVLLVESDPAMQQHLTSLCRTWGYDRVLAATTVDEAITALAHNAFLFTLLLDFDLNGSGVDAMEFLRRLEIQGGSPGPILILSGEASVEPTSEAGALGCGDFIQQPCIPENLENAINEPSRAPAAPLVGSQTARRSPCDRRSRSGAARRCGRSGRSSSAWRGSM